MLRKILHLAAERGALHSGELARALDASPELVDLALAELARRGYIRVLTPGCSTACKHCPLRAACQHRRLQRVWMLAGEDPARLAQEHD